MRGVDPYGVKVFAAGRKAPGTDWELVARINETDALASLDGVARSVGLVAALGVAACWLIAAFLWRNQQFVRISADRRFRMAFEQAAVGMAHVGLDGKFLRVNRRLAEMLGYSAEELLG